jgi:hypothetical protein
MPLNRNKRPAVSRRQDVGLDLSLKIIVERNRQPIGVARGFEEFFRDRLAGNPPFDRAIVDGE